MLAAVKSEGYALRFASARLADTYAVVRTAIESDSYALAFASESMQDREDLVRWAMEAGADVRHASWRLRSKRSLALDAVRIDYQNYYGIAEQCQCDIEIALEFVRVAAAAGCSRQYDAFGLTDICNDGLYYFTEITNQWFYNERRLVLAMIANPDWNLILDPRIGDMRPGAGLLLFSGEAST